MLLEIIGAVFGLLIFLGGIGAALNPEGENKRRQASYMHRTLGQDVYIPPKKKNQSLTVEPSSMTSSTDFIDTSSRDSYWGLISFAYQKLKQTSIYRRWRNEQFDCQFGKCGICGKPMDRDYTQLDHIKARYDYGTNYSDNLVLVHPKCNENKGASAGSRPDWIKENSRSREFDKKAWDILQTVREEYPDEVPDSLIKPPQSIEEYEDCQRAELDSFSHVEPNDPVIDDELGVEGDNTKVLTEQATSEDTTSQLGTHTLASYEERTHVNPSSLFREGFETDIERGTAIHNSDAVEGEDDWDDIMLARHDAEMSAEYSPDVDDPEYASDQYMSYDYDDWSDKYGPEW